MELTVFAWLRKLMTPDPRAVLMRAAHQRMQDQIDATQQFIEAHSHENRRQRRRRRKRR